METSSENRARMPVPDREVIVVGSGPNGLAAAIEMARAGYPVTVMEAAETIGGGARTAQLTLPGYLHDICSAVHPLARPHLFSTPSPLPVMGCTGFTRLRPSPTLLTTAPQPYWKKEFSQPPKRSTFPTGGHTCS